MREKYETIENLNQVFGLDYWSNRINSWEDFPSMEGSINGSLGEICGYYPKPVWKRYGHLYRMYDKSGCYERCIRTCCKAIGTMGRRSGVIIPADYQIWD